MRKRKTYIHVNQHVIRSNKKNNENEPVITVKQGSKNTYCHKVQITDLVRWFMEETKKLYYLVVLVW
jgi:hypothetical protein